MDYIVWGSLPGATSLRVAFVVIAVCALVMDACKLSMAMSLYRSTVPAPHDMAIVHVMMASAVVSSITNILFPVLQGADAAMSHINDVTFLLLIIVTGWKDSWREVAVTYAAVLRVLLCGVRLRKENKWWFG
jgi:hypothetical protein